jgi:hypothetical protein
VFDGDKNHINIKVTVIFLYTSELKVTSYVTLNTLTLILISFFYVVKTVHFGMKMYNDQRNAQVFNLFIYLLMPFMVRAFF